MKTAGENLNNFQKNTVWSIDRQMSDLCLHYHAASLWNAAKTETEIRVLSIDIELSGYRRRPITAIAFIAPLSVKQERKYN